MTAYKNLEGNSGVTAYEIGEDSIKIRFTNGPVYLYTNSVTGVNNIKQMKKLARAGRGLSTFISTTVKDKYAAKL
jgi:hypothetical protein